jgi:hypothetical protein
MRMMFSIVFSMFCLFHIQTMHSRSLSIQAYVVYDNGKESKKNKLLTYQTHAIGLTESLSS